MPEMSPDRYKHTRGVYCCIVMWHGFQFVESYERAKDKASQYTLFCKYVIRLPLFRSQIKRFQLPQRGVLIAKLIKIGETHNRMCVLCDEGLFVVGVVVGCF